jgi:hypothetical protein
VQSISVEDMLSWASLPGDWWTRSASSAGRQPGQEQQLFELVAAVQRAHLDVSDVDDPTAQRVIVEIQQGDDGQFLRRPPDAFRCDGGRPNRDQSELIGGLGESPILFTASAWTAYRRCRAGFL